MIRTTEELYQLYPEPKERALKKQLSRAFRIAGNGTDDSRANRS